uniref:Pentatricopeptide repeat-containing protein n=1 Tax=Nelumbo nucifera TaxID=4432 RepID=A0A822ZGI5_NELNU|nr:TPA_asm: hypothetical protein HUJ06_000386 [Nelumbo nucifera]
MISRQLPSLFLRSKTTIHLLQIHCLILKTALDFDPLSVSGFISSACSISVDFARVFFDRLPISPPLFSWNSIIRQYAKSPQPIEAVKLFSGLLRTGIRPDNFTYPFVLKACGRCSMLEEGGAVHSLIFKTGLYSDRYIGNTLLRMYAACSAIGFSRQVFDEMTYRDVVSWSSIIAGYVACNLPLNALRMFQNIKLENVQPNSVTLELLSSRCMPSVGI